MKTKGLFLPLVAILAVGPLAEPVMAQGGPDHCFPCRCCDDWCYRQGSDIGLGSYGFKLNLCPSECVNECGEMEQEEIASMDFDQIWDALNSANPETVQEVINAHPTRLIVNQARKAVQIYGCNDRLVGHVTLSDETFIRLTLNPSWPVP